MEDIILNKDLKYILKNLNLEQKGLLLDLLLEEQTITTDKQVENTFTYIIKQQEKITSKKQKMKALSLLAHSAKAKKRAQSSAQSFTDDTPSLPLLEELRKEPKEIINNLNNINKKNNLPNKISFSNSLSIPPTIDEVKSYILAHNYQVDAETFVDFYTSRNWCVGKSEIKNWQATVRMWNRRAKYATNTSTIYDEDENYWHELKQKFWQTTSHTPPLPPPIKELVTSPSNTPQFPKIDSNFSRYMQSIEKNDF